MKIRRGPFIPAKVSSAPPPFRVYARKRVFRKCRTVILKSYILESSKNVIQLCPRREKFISAMNNSERVIVKKD